jgi:hypothetical protein
MYALPSCSPAAPHLQQHADTFQVVKTFPIVVREPNAHSRRTVEDWAGSIWFANKTSTLLLIALYMTGSVPLDSKVTGAMCKHIPWPSDRPEPRALGSARSRGLLDVFRRWGEMPWAHRGASIICLQALNLFAVSHRTKGVTLIPDTALSSEWLHSCGDGWYSPSSLASISKAQQISSSTQKDTKCM